MRFDISLWYVGIRRIINTCFTHHDAMLRDHYSAIRSNASVFQTIEGWYYQKELVLNRADSLKKRNEDTVITILYGRGKTVYRIE